MAIGTDTLGWTGLDVGPRDDTLLDIPPRSIQRWRIELISPRDGPSGRVAKRGAHHVVARFSSVRGRLPSSPTVSCVPSLRIDLLSY